MASTPQSEEFFALDVTEGVEKVFLGDYQGIRMIRETLFGHVTIARRLGCDCEELVAIKQSNIFRDGKKKLAEDPQEEIRILTKLRRSKLDGRQYVAQLIDTFTVKSYDALHVYAVLEFVRHELFDYIQQPHVSDPTRSIFRMIVLGLDFIHKNGISHGDLSLENVLVSDKGFAKICDFGAAREGSLFASTEIVRGKARYVAPEVFEKKSYDGFKADIWSLGVILWCMLTKRGLYQVPRASDSRFASLMLGKEGITKLFELVENRGASETSIDLLSKMLKMNPSERISISEILSHPWILDQPLKAKDAPKRKKRKSRSVASSSG